jgi:hypothetical protein
MIEILEFVFGSFWTFTGTIILLLFLAEIIVVPLKFLLMRQQIKNDKK